jgi:hypothetical protein
MTNLFLVARPRAWALAALVGAALAAGPAGAADKPSSKSVKEILEKADTFELYSLDPGPRKVAGGFHGWKVLGKTPVKDAAARKRILAAVYKGLADSDGTVANCFNPRHGIRATHKGKTVDLVICFECLQVQFHAGKEQATELTTASPQPTLDKVLKDAGVPLAKKAGK